MMASPETAFLRRGAWDGIVSPGHYGAQRPSAGVTVRLIDDLSLASITAPRGGEQALAEAVMRRYAVALPRTPRAVEAAGLTLIWNGPRQWLACAPAAADAVTGWSETLGSVAAIADQTGSRAVLRIGGLQVRATLAKGFAIDLHPQVFEIGDVALTSVSHQGAQIRRTGEDEFEIMVARSMAGSFWSWLSHSALMYRLQVT